MAEINVRESLKRDVPWVLGIAIFGYATYLAMIFGFGVDSHAYWQAIRGEYYSNAPGTIDAFLYSPAFAQLLWPLAQLPWPVFNMLWMLAATASLTYLLRPLGWRLSVPALLACTPEIFSGNVFWIFAMVVAFGLRFPALWAFVFLTKITPAIGPIWFAMRREWTNVSISAVATVVVVGTSYAIDPEAWFAWIEFLRTHLSSTKGQVGGLSLPPVVRIPLAVALILWGALRTKYWTIPTAMVLATPVFGIASLVVFAGLPRLAVGKASSKSVENDGP
uniref:DUF2029 domain-containing protein n=1 Tax=uncultured bacterium A1Q1_fos_1053 TaxID=1256539 RepID=L7VRI0_9BACT|nr:hypothetical protein [uncultured bacterium A1Q1_fos_1053]